MSGVITIRNDRSWVVASWAYDYVLYLTRKYIPKQRAEKLSELIDEQTEGALRIIVLDDLPGEEKEVFVNALQKAYEEAASMGSQEFKSPEFYPGFMKAFRELIDMILEQDGLQEKPEGQ